MDAPLFDTLNALFAEEYTYSGAPVRYSDRVMGALCVMGPHAPLTTAEEAQLEGRMPLLSHARLRLL